MRKNNPNKRHNSRKCPCQPLYKVYMRVDSRGTILNRKGYTSNSNRHFSKKLAAAIKSSRSSWESKERGKNVTRKTTRPTKTITLRRKRTRHHMIKKVRARILTMNLTASTSHSHPTSLYTVSISASDF